MKYILKFYILFLFTACSLLSSESHFKEIDFPQTPETLYEKSLGNHFKSFLKNNKSKIIKLRSSEKKYFEDLIQELLSSNQTFFTNIFKLKKINFYFIKSKDAYFFSIPGDGIIMSSEVISKYIENEDVLVSLILFELIKMEYLLYPKKQKVMIGVDDEKQMIQMTQVQDITTRLKIHEWSYRLMRRTIFDQGTYLLWQQIMIRNNKNFEAHLGGYKNLAREERKLKSFVIGIEKNDSTDIDDNDAVKVRKTPRVFYELTERLNV